MVDQQCRQVPEPLSSLGFDMGSSRHTHGNRRCPEESPGLSTGLDVFAPAAAREPMTPVTILVSSFDGYSDCWGPVCHGFTKYWPNCPYPVLLMTNEKDHQHP